MSQEYPKYEVRAGRFHHDQTTKKVKVSKDKGKLTFFTVPQHPSRTAKAKTM